MTFLHNAGIVVGVILLIGLALSELGLFLALAGIAFGLPMLLLGLLGGWHSLLMIGGVPLGAGVGLLLINSVFSETSKA